MKTDEPGSDAPEKIKKIQQIESEVERMVDEAEKNHHAQIRDAKRRGAQMIEEAEKEAERNGIASLEREIRKAEAEAGDIIRIAEEKIETLRERTRTRREEGAGWILGLLYPELFNGEGK